MAANSQAVNQIKVWFFPILMGILGTIIWSDVKDIKADVKALMAQSNIDKTRIDNLEKQVDFFRQRGSSKSTGLMAGLMKTPFTPDEPTSRYIYTKELYVDTRQKKYVPTYGKKKPDLTL